MRIVDLLRKEAVVLNAEVSTKEQMLDLLVDLHKEVGNIKDKAAFNVYLHIYSNKNAFIFPRVRNW